MTRTSLRVEVAGPREVAEVWRRYTTPALWADWAPQIRGVDHPESRIRPGSAGVVRGPIGVRVPFVVEDLDDGTMRWSWTPRVGPVRVRMTHGVDVDGRGSLAWVEIGGVSLLVRAYAPVARVALRRLVAG